MKKILLSLLLLIVAALVGLYFYLGVLIKKAVETYVPPITQTSVTVSSVGLNLFAGEVSVKGVMIGNPNGFKTPSVFELGSVDVKIDLGSLLKDVIVIDLIDIKKVAVMFEVTPSGTNVGALNNNIQKYTNSSTKPETAVKAAAPTKPGKKVIIKKVRISDSTVGLAASAFGQGQSITVPLPDITLSNLGEEKKPMDPVAAFAQILNKISLESIQTFTKNASKLVPSLQDGVDAVQGTVSAVKEGASGAAQQAKDIANGIKGMFK